MKENYGASKKDIERGYLKEKETHELDDSPHNSQWRDLDDGGFLGRPKGHER